MTRAADACPSLAACVDGLALTTIQRHVFICADQTKPKCCDKADSIVAWNYLKNRLKELGLDRPSADSPASIFRTKAIGGQVVADFAFLHHPLSPAVRP